ncbi:hypothetical protein PMAYCL1PPCAC_28001, partial [Pristionchus mayeri]
QMAPAADYLFISIETLVNGISIAIMIPCVITLIRTQVIHDNCKVLLVTSASAQTLLLISQMSLFANNYITENLLPKSQQRSPFIMMQYICFIMSSQMSMVIVLERAYAVWKAAEYEKVNRHLVSLLILIGSTLIMSLLHVYAINWHDWLYESIILLYAIEGSTLIISIVLIIYARRKIRVLPYDGDRLRAKYQVREVLDFPIAILPSIILSAIMHTLSLVPTILLSNDLVTYPVSSVFYFSIHSLNCIFTKLALIACHKGMRERFQRMIFRVRCDSRKAARIEIDAEKEGKEHFEQMRAAWDGP